MTRTTSAAVLAGLSTLAAGATATLLANLIDDVIPAFEGVLDDDWGSA